MEEEQEEALEYLKYQTETGNLIGGYTNIYLFQKKLETVLNLIQEKDTRIEELEKALIEEQMKHTAEMEKKDKRIANLEYILLDMVMQFADRHKIKGCEYGISTMGLSALELAFSELNLNNPTKIKEADKMYIKLQKQYFERKVEAEVKENENRGN